jgi:hypothetical protein
MIAPQLAGAQIDDKKKEQAYYEVSQRGEQAFFTDLNVSAQPFDERIAVRFTSDILEKEGVFGVELHNGGKTLRVYHLSYIDQDGIKSFMTPYLTDFHVEEPQPYSF